ncbi:MAG TPA: CBS domain-containing protein [Actinopolymorphaceae bacterium]
MNDYPTESPPLDDAVEPDRDLPHERPERLTAGDVMAVKPRSVDASADVAEIAETMRAEGIGDVVVILDGEARGILTDRDLVTRVIAEGLDASTVTAADICTMDPVVVPRELPIADVERVMREHAVRRLPVVDREEKVIGVVALGDIAVTTEPHSALADITAAPPNV